MCNCKGKNTEGNNSFINRYPTRYRWQNFNPTQNTNPNNITSEIIRLGLPSIGIMTTVNHSDYYLRTFMSSAYYSIALKLIGNSYTIISSKSQKIISRNKEKIIFGLTFKDKNTGDEKYFLILVLNGTNLFYPVIANKILGSDSSQFRFSSGLDGTPFPSIKDKPVTDVNEQPVPCNGLATTSECLGCLQNGFGGSNPWTTLACIAFGIPCAAAMLFYCALLPTNSNDDAILSKGWVRIGNM